jgi:hypothetical protein
MDYWIEQYMKMFMISPTTAPKYESLSLDTHHSHSSNSQIPIQPDSSGHLLSDRPQSPTQRPAQVRSNFDIDFRKDLTKRILRNSMEKLHTEEKDITVSEPGEQALKNSKPSQLDIRTRKSLSSMAGLARTESRSLSNTSFTSHQSEEAYVSGMLKGYERGMKISQSLEKTNSNSADIPKKDSSAQVPDVEIAPVDESMCTVAASLVKRESTASSPNSYSDEQTTSKGRVLLFPGIVKRKSYKDRLDQCLQRNGSNLRQKARIGCARSAKIHSLLAKNPNFKDSLSQIMNRKHRESIDMGIKSYTALDPAERADLYKEKVDSFKEKVESVVKNIMKDKSFYEQIPTMHLPSISVYSPAQSEQQSIDLGKILALSDDIKDMVEYWRTHSLISLNSEVSKRRERNAISEGTSTSALQSEAKSTDVTVKTDEVQVIPHLDIDDIRDNRPVSTEDMQILDNSDAVESDNTLSNMNSSFLSTECMTSVEGSVTSTSLSDQTDISSNKGESNDFSEHRSNILKQLDVGLVTKLATSAGDLVTYDIVCMTTPGIIIEKCWLYWKVVAIVALSSVERDGRVQVGDILFEIDGQSLRGFDKSVVAAMLRGYQHGRLLHLTLLKRSIKPDNTGKRLLATRSIARFTSKCHFLVDDEIRYSSKFKSALEAGGFL